LHPKSFRGNREEIIGKKILYVERRAKLLIIGLGEKSDRAKVTLSGTEKAEGTENFLLIHLKMTGQLIYRSVKYPVSCIKEKKSPFDVEQLPNKYTRVMIEFNNGARLYFNDLRIFGWMKVVEDLDKAIGEKFGPEPFSKEFTTDYLKKVFSRSSKTIKLVLMDQEKIAGVGNIYANEALYRAGILPTKPAKKLSDQEVEKLRKATIGVLEDGLKYGGSSAADEAYRNVVGQKGKMQKHFKVYERERMNCLRCQDKIKKIKLGGRGTYFCPRCQR
jgi:formamidopyrimidine-DNA glycosylase